MPFYTFKHPKKERYIEIFQHMDESHEYFEDGHQWERVFHSPNAAVCTRLDGSEGNFRTYFDNKKGTIGDAWDASREASEKRKKEMGHDPVKENYFKEYSKKRRGLKHPDQRGEV